MAGLYIHIPFCASRCNYCDFYSTTLLSKRSDYVKAVLREWNAKAHDWKNNIDTIYIGGGTPTMLDDMDLTNLINTILADLPHLPKEITLEANPCDLTLQKLHCIKQANVNRLSVGIQSFNDSLLTLMGRRHNASQAKDAITNAQKVGFDNISIDLIYGIPNQTISDWQQDIEQALALEPQHLSAYCLTYENGTKLTQLLLDGKIQPVEDTTENEMYDYLVNTLAKHHYHHYEVSNFAKQTYESKHNSSYWTHTPYLGLGAGAHSYNNDTRWWNINDVNAYINATHFEDIQQKEWLSKQDLRTERIMLGLRTANGIDTNEVDPQVVQKHINLGYLTLNNQRICATLDGYHILNRIIEDLI